MNSKVKKIVKIVLSVLVAILALLIVLPIVFKDKITDIALKEVNKHLNADIGFDKLKISLIRDFPNASINIKDLYVAGRDDFAGDTLIHSKDLKLVVNMKSIFSGSGFEVKRLSIEDSKVFAHELSDGSVNWDIMPENEDKKEEKSSSSSFSMQLQDVKVLRTDIIFLSDTSNMAATLDNLNVYLKGDFTADNTLLKTKLSVESISFWNEGIRLANNLSLDMKADIEAYFNDSKYVLANNEIILNAIPLSLNGWVQMPDDAINMDLTLDAQKVDFKSLLSLVPAIYSTEFDKLSADGNVSLSGFMKGRYHEDTLPSFEFDLKVEDGRFSYPDLPKSVDNVQVVGRITNEGGSMDMTVVDISKLSLSMGGNPLSATLNLRQPISDMFFKLTADGKLDLGMIKDVYPLEQGTELNGVLQMDIDAAGSMMYVEQNRYEDFKFDGNVNVRDMLVDVAEMNHSIEVSHADLIFNDRFLNLSSIDIKIGDNDLKGSGKVENYVAYALRDKTLIGEMSIQSNHFNLNDFMTESEGDTTTMTVIKVPTNLNLTLNGDFKELIFDKMKLENAEAQLRIANGELNINRMNVSAFGGTMALNGKYSTLNPNEPVVDFDVDLKQISFGEVMSQVESLKRFAPIFDKVAGRFDTKMSLHTLLSGDMMPILSSMLSNGNFKAEMITLKEDVKALNELSKALKLDNMSDFSLKDLALSFNIEDGKLETKPFDINIKDYKLNIGGLTGLDQSIQYSGSIRLPDKLNLKQFQTIGFKIGGTFQNPKVELDLKSTISDLVDGEKEKIMDKVDSIKTELADRGREEADKALMEAKRRADQIIEQANRQSEIIINKARAQGDSIISKAKNPIAKELAKKGAEELLKQAQIQAESINEQAEAEANKLIQRSE